MDISGWKADPLTNWKVQLIGVWSTQNQILLKVNKTHNNQIIFSIIKWINHWFLCGSDSQKYIYFWEDKVNTWVSTRGIRDTCKRIKTIQLHVTKYLGGHPSMTSEEVSLSINSQGLPKSLGILQELIVNKDVKQIRLLLTLLNVRRAWMFKSDPNLDPITSKHHGSSFLEAEVTKTVSDLGWKIPIPHWVSPHLSTKAGPNGLATVSSLEDLAGIPEGLENDLSILGGSDFRDYIQLLRKYSRSIASDYFQYKQTNARIRKLSVVNDPEGKARIIAILDWWSQTVLLPLHDALFKHLRSISSDCTFNQLNHRTLKKGPYYSIDLTQATDRFPVKTQISILGALVGNTEWAEAWGRVMVEHEFYVPWTGQTVKYGVGQPMGAYSSWAMFSVAHHVLVRLAATMAGKSVHWSNYILLGDDIVIGGKEVADKYLQLLSTLGIEHSPYKTHISETTYEFAKRIFYLGTDVSGSQIRPFLSNKWYLLTQEFSNLCHRWGLDPLERASPDLLRGLLGLHGKTRCFTKALKFLNFPKCSDSDEVLLTKAINFNQLYFKGALGCSRSSMFLLEFQIQTITEVKANILEKAIISCQKTRHNFQSELAKRTFKYLLRPDLVDQTILWEHPVIKGLVAHQTDLQDLFDKLRTAYWDNDLEIALGKTVTVPSDPTRYLKTRSHELILASTASLVNKYSLWCREYLRARTYLFGSEDQPVDETT